MQPVKRCVEKERTQRCIFLIALEQLQTHKVAIKSNRPKGLARHDGGLCAKDGYDLRRVWCSQGGNKQLVGSSDGEFGWHDEKFPKFKFGDNSV